MSRNILGLDIRRHSVSAVLVKSGLKVNRIEARSRTLISDRQEIESGLAGCLETIRTNSDLSGADCIVAFPPDRISFRNLQVPFREKKKIRQILPFEIEPTLPYPIDDLVIDFYTTHAAEHTDLVAAAIEKSDIEACLNTLAKFKLEPRIITAGGFVTAQCLARFDHIPQNALFLDVDDGSSTLCLIASGQIHFVRAFAFQPGSPADIAAALAIETKRTLNAFESAAAAEFAPEAIFITGGGITDEAFGPELSGALNCPVEFTDMAAASDCTLGEAVTSWSPRWMDNALAPALAETEGITALNFRKGPFAIQKHWVKFRKEILHLSVLAGLILGLIFAGTIMESMSLEKRIGRMDTRIRKIFSASFPEVRRIVDPVQQMRLKLESVKKQSAYPGENEIKTLRIDILNDISRLIPDQTDIDLSQLVIGPENVLIAGNTDTFNSVNTIKSRLEQSDLFSKVTISSANIDKSDNRVRFNLAIRLSSAPAAAPPREGNP